MTAIERRPCPRCGYEMTFEERSVIRCTECGSSIDWSREVALERERNRVPAATGWMIVAGLFGIPVLFAMLGATAYAGGPTGAFRVAFPYTWLLLSAGGQASVAIGMLLGLLQGPFYGLVLGLHPSPRMHPRIWGSLFGAHAVAAVVALLV